MYRRIFSLTNIHTVNNKCYKIPLYRYFTKFLRNICLNTYLFSIMCICSICSMYGGFFYVRYFITLIFNYIFKYICYFISFQRNIRLYKNILRLYLYKIWSNMYNHKPEHIDFGFYLLWTRVIIFFLSSYVMYNWNK